MTSAQRTVVQTAIATSLTICCCCIAGDENKCHVTADLEIQWSGGEGGGCSGGGCGGHDGGTCDGQDGGTCDGHDGGTCSGGSQKYAYVSIIARQDAPSGEASGILRHWVTNERTEDDGIGEADANAEEDASDGDNLHRDILVMITTLVRDSAKAYLVGQCIYDSKMMDNKMGQWLVVEVLDGGTPGREGDTLAWKWFSEDALTGIECSDMPLNPKEILAGNLMIHYKPED